MIGQLAAMVVVAFAFVLFAFGGLVFTKPATAERILMRFASSAQTHYLEQVARLLVGASLVVQSPAMWQPRLFWLIGWVIVVSSAALMCIPWQWHHRFAERVRPMFFRFLWVYAACSIAFGVLLLCGV